MGHCYHHALPVMGGTAEDYLPLHQWFDESKASGFRVSGDRHGRLLFTDRNSATDPSCRR